MKKAREKIEQKTVEQAENKVRQVPQGEALTDDLVGSVLAGALVADRVLGERIKVESMRALKSEEHSAMVNKNGSLRRAYNEASSKIMSCRSSAIEKVDAVRAKEEEKRDAAREVLEKDPNFMAKMQLAGMKYAKAMAAAVEKNDAAALAKAQRDMLTEAYGDAAAVSYDTKKDNAAVDAQCGKEPALPPALKEEDRVGEEVSAADARIRTLEAQAINSGAKASGLEELRYLQLKERVRDILAQLGDAERRKRPLNVEELAVKKRQVELEKVLRAL